MTGDEIFPYKLPLNDKKVFKTFTCGDLDNIFQFDSLGMKNILADFQPESIHDLTIINALYRPGMLQFIPTLIQCKFNYDDTIYKGDSRVSDILKGDLRVFDLSRNPSKSFMKLQACLIKMLELMRQVHIGIKAIWN
ncbi:MAG: hypothetical protein IPP37_02985 [Saprospiraceae bacterium]|nr:hypothetical protein [Saprospiraceae bacterium]